MSSITNIRTTSPVNTFVGPGSSQVAGKLIHDMGLNKVMVVCDETVKNFGLADPAIGSMEEAGIEVVIFDHVLPDPPDVIVKDAIKLYRENNCQAIVAVGGGSAIDTGKAVAMMQGNEGELEDYLLNPMKPRVKGAPLIAIPTTSGTGSEVTYAAVVTDTKSGAKIGFGGPDLFATAALLDPLLIVGLPKGGTAMTGMDVYAHAVESMLSVMSNPMSELLSLEAIRLVVENLETAIEDGTNLEARQNMMFAAYLAGMAVNDGGCTIGHATAHTLGAAYHITHGALCAHCVPMTIEYFASVFPEKIKKIGQVLGVNTDNMSEEEAAKAVADNVRELNKRMGMKSFKELGIPYEDLPVMAEKAMYDSCTYALKFTRADKEITPDDFLTAWQKEYKIQLGE